MNKKNLLYSFGGLAVLSSSVATVVACATPSISNNSTEQIDVSRQKLLQSFHHSLEVGLIENFKDKTWVDLINFDTQKATIIQQNLNVSLPKLFDDKEMQKDLQWKLILLLVDEHHFEIESRLIAGINSKKINTAQLISKKFIIPLKPMTIEQKTQIVKHVAHQIKQKNGGIYKTKWDGKSVQSLPSENHLIHLRDLQIDIDGQGLELSAKILNSSQRGEGTINVEINVEKWGIKETTTIEVYGFAESLIHKNLQDVKNFKQVLSKNKNLLKMQNGSEPTINSLVVIPQVLSEKLPIGISSEIKIKYINRETFILEVIISKGSGSQKIQAEMFLEVAKKQFTINK